MNKWVKILYGLPTSGPARQMLSDFLVRSGLLANGWQVAVEQLKEIVRELLDEGHLKAEKTPDGVFFTDPHSRHTAEYRVISEPNPVRHSLPDTLPPLLQEELGAMNSVKWRLLQPMVELAINLEQEGVSDSLSELVKGKAFYEALAAAEELDGHYNPYFLDAVGRAYGEGTFSFTSNYLVRYSQQVEEQIPYTKERCKEICKLIGFDINQTSDILANAGDLIARQGLKAFAKINAAIWVQEILTGTGRSGAMGAGDLRTCGPMFAAIAAQCQSLMCDCNILGEDGRDCRNVIAGRVSVHSALQPWRDEILGKAKKPLVTQLLYGQAADGGAESMFWEDSESKEILGWKSRYGRVDEAICLHHKTKWNSDFAEVIGKLGPARAWSAFRSLSSEFNSTFWRSYPEVLVLRQKVEKAYDHHMAKHGCPPTLEMPHGWAYTHRKWIIKEDGDSYRFRYEGKGSEKPLDITIKEMEDVASGFSLFVRIVHMWDAWARNQINRRVIKRMKKKYGKYIGHASVHDSIIVPYDFLPEMHSIIRAVLHEVVERFPVWINEFLVANGQEPVEILPPHVQARIHQSIARNKAFFNF